MPHMATTQPQSYRRRERFASKIIGDIPLDRELPEPYPGHQTIRLQQIPPSRRRDQVFSSRGTMPTYDYACTSCGNTWELEQRIVENPAKKCPKCEKNTAKRQISGGGAFILKGGGWYADGYGAKKSSSTESKADDKSSKSETKSTSGDSKDAKKESTEKSSGGDTKTDSGSTGGTGGGGGSKDTKASAA